MNDDTVYLITSFRRSGSSMMARCLKLGGLPVVYREENDRQFNDVLGAGGRTREDYAPNPNGFFAIEGFIDFEAPTFYEEYKGNVLKIPRADMKIVPPGKYILIFMTRDQDEILASYRDFIGTRTWGMAENSVHFYDMIKDATIASARKRDDFRVIEVNYNELLEDPIAAFQEIKDFGVPIDVERAASGVDLSLYRHRLKK